MFIAAKYIHRKIKSRNQSPTDDSPTPVTEKKPSCPHSRPFQVELRTGAFENARTSEGTASILTEDDRVLVPKEPPTSDEKCQVCKKQKHDMRVYRWKLIAGLFLPFTLATLDLTIVATALPSIASHFNEFDEQNWIVTAFTLTSTTFIPMFGQFADVFGRGATIHVSLFLMIIGSVLCAAAQTWGMLLLGRALQGVSDAGLMNVVMIILSDKVSLKESAKTKSLFMLVGGIGYAIGPTVGGYLTDANWRYCFVISIPIAVISQILIFILLRNELVEGTMFKKGSRLSGILPALATVDIIGSILFIFGVGLIILATAWGGATYPWSSPQVLAPLIIGSVCFVLFFVYEYLLEPGRIFARIFPKQVAMLPYSMFARRDTIWLAIVQFSTGAAMYSVFYYIGIYFSLVEAYPASRAGVQLLYYIPGMGAGVYMAVFFCNVWPAQTFVPLNIGALVSTVGLGMVVYAIHTQDTGLINGMMAITGAGTGLRFMPATLHMVGVWPEKIAPAQSLMRFAQPFGGTLCLTIMGSVFNNKFAQSSIVSRGASAGGDLDVHDSNSLSFIADLPADAQRSVRMAGKDAIMWAFIAILPIMGLSLVTGLFIGNVWIKPKPKDEEQRDAWEDEGSHSEVIYVPYLWALLTGNIDSYKKTNKVLPNSDSKAADFNNSSYLHTQDTK
ncbi:major facilitator superfamily domain-containing protein [Aspergillus bertholletiae]|uniref:Major facilitator superfamily domain-containing protein n=1 Tax=Aspergillus bertholletiae TaxID=1226010 RepID=A0A5N7AQQ4_9EURO|nr:major facilitator superfamily domain-containing protein [Aspergillus bertholletiae]